MENIQNYLNEDRPLIKISETLDKDPRGISRHIKKYRILVPAGKNQNRCFNLPNCIITHVCPNLKCLNGKCKYCGFYDCNKSCEKFLECPSCKRLLKFPFVCNGCPKRSTCESPKYIYQAISVAKTAREQLVNTRKHTHFSKEELERIDSIVAPLILVNKLSPEVILIKEIDLNFSLSTFYNLIDKKLLPSLINVDLKRKVRYKTRSGKREKVRPNPKYLEGRSYDDFINHLSKTNNLAIREVDTVEGRKGGKAIMTLLHRNTNFMLMFLIESVETSEIIRIFDFIKDTIGTSLFKNTFKAILGDNGKEFKNPEEIEINHSTGEKCTSYYYCLSRQSQQKGKIEKNHEHLREIYPKGTSFDNLTQSDVNKASLYVNNYPRPQFNGASPLEFFSIICNKKILTLNSLKLINYKDLKTK